MAKQHATTLRSKAYSMDGLENVIWGEDWDVEYFANNSTDVIWETNPWHVWPKSKGTKDYSTHCAQIDGASIQLDLHMIMLSKVDINNL